MFYMEYQLVQLTAAPVYKDDILGFVKYQKNFQKKSLSTPTMEGGIKEYL